MTNTDKTSLDDYIQKIHYSYPKEWIESRDVADILGIHPEILYRNRVKKEGIPFLKIGKKVVYLKKDVIAFIRQSYVQTKTSDEK